MIFLFMENNKKEPTFDFTLSGISSQPSSTLSAIVKSNKHILPLFHKSSTIIDSLALSPLHDMMIPCNFDVGVPSGTNRRNSSN